ncbi:hypothetical protein [Roseibium sp. RKSG952]|uniref:hypothetical protein n=1 Tax=Roseibium sp. RKSG952 TaxID=2529384 RepID=UPI0012BD56BF|nr:hypothetical protein [Roseibium sp. RKSG952]MTH96773.1 hypothetical protein [Roseibium sp. RKSG952]
MAVTVDWVVMTAAIIGLGTTSLQHADNSGTTISYHIPVDDDTTQWSVKTDLYGIEPTSVTGATWRHNSDGYVVFENEPDADPVPAGGSISFTVEVAETDADGYGGAMPTSGADVEMGAIVGAELVMSSGTYSFDEATALALHAETSNSADEAVDSTATIDGGGVSSTETAPTLDGADLSGDTSTTTPISDTTDSTSGSPDASSGSGDGVALTGDNLLAGGSGDDIIFGGSDTGGSDGSGSSGDEIIYGGAGADDIVGGSEDPLSGSSGSDAVYDGTSTDTGGSSPTLNLDLSLDPVELVNPIEIIEPITLSVDQDQTLETEDLVTLVPLDLSGAEDSYEVGEWGTVDVDHGWTSVNLSYSYENPVVVAFITTTNGNQIVETRIKDVADKGFSIKLQETSNHDGSHAIETVSYLVMEEGRHTLNDGSIVEAATVETDKVQQNTLKEGYESVEFLGDMTNASVFTSSNTYNGSDWITTRVHNVDDGGFSVAMAEQEAKTDGHTDETIGWIAFENGNYDRFDVSQVRADEVAVNVGDVDLAQIVKVGGLDPAVLRMKDNDLWVQEDTSRDSETGHAFDTVALLDFNTDSGVIYATDTIIDTSLISTTVEVVTVEVG